MLTLGAPQPVELDRVLAALTRGLAQAAQTELGLLDLQVAFTAILDELRRTEDRVDDRADEREQGRSRRGTDEHRVVDPSPGIGEGPVDK